MLCVRQRQVAKRAQLQGITTEEKALYPGLTSRIQNYGIGLQVNGMCAKLTVYSLEPFDSSRKYGNEIIHWQDTSVES